MESNINKDFGNVNNVVNKIDKISTIANKYINLIEKYKFVIYYYFAFIFLICFTSIYVNSVLLKDISVVFMVVYIILIIVGLVGIYLSWIIVKKTIETGELDIKINEKEIVDIF